MLGELSSFLDSAFSTPEHRFAFAPDVLRWKYLAPSGFGTPSRSLLVRENGRIVAHIGLHFTRFNGLEAVHPYDWIAAGTRSPQGLLLLMRMHRMGDVHYVFGCTEKAANVFERSGYRVVMTAPLFQRVLDPAAWRHIHGRQPLWKKAALLTVDRSRSLLHPGGPARRPVELRPVSAFGQEIEAILRLSPSAIRSSRDPMLLNHFLAYPLKTVRGWHLFRDQKLRGLALANTVQKGPIRVGKILDCIVDAQDTDLWHAAIFGVVSELRALGCQRVEAYGSTPWTAQALRANGFFERGHTPLRWRDVKEQIPLDKPFHLTYFEADTGLL